MKSHLTKTLLSVFVLLALWICGQAMAQGTLNDGLLAFYSFGGNANDSTGNGNNGTNTGGIYIADRFGNPQSAIYFPATGMVTTGFTPPTGSAARTFSGWFDVPATNMDMTLMAYGDPNAAARIEIKINGAGQFALDTSDGTLWTSLSYNDNNWHNFIIVLNSNTTLGNVLFYLDGELQSNVTSDAPNNVLNTIGTNPLQFGQIIPLVGGNRQLIGALDQIAIYDRALSSNEVAELYEIESENTPDLPPAITIQPQSLTVSNRDSASFRVTAFDFNPLAYQWYFNSQPLSGQNNSSLVFSSAQYTNTGCYFVIITNSWGAVTSAIVTLAVIAPPTFISPPMSEVGYWGFATTFSFRLDGAPSTYQWYFDGTALIGATNAMLTLTNLDLDQAGEYWVAVTNQFGSVVSTPASLLVNPAGVFLGLYPGLTITGAVGKSFGIQYSTDLSQSNGWTTITNVTLSQPAMMWFDSYENINNGAQLRRFYRVVAIP